jgi:hypothetical protein
MPMSLEKRPKNFLNMGADEIGGRQRPLCLTRIAPGEGMSIYSVPTEAVKGYCIVAQGVVLR